MTKKHAIHFDKPVVMRVNPARRVSLFLLILALIIAGPVVSFYATNTLLGKENTQMEETLSKQSILIDQLSSQVADLKQINENNSLSSEVDRHSIENMRQEIVVSQKQTEFLNEQIVFYQSLMDPDPDKGGVYIEAVEIKPDDEVPAQFQYNLVVAQRSSNHQKITGVIEIEFISENNGETAQTLILSSLTEESNPIHLGFKFFQVVEGNWSFPEDFSPNKYRVLVYLNGQSTPSLDETYIWNL